MICILDHQDSFTYNIFSVLKKRNANVQVFSTLKTKLIDLQSIEHKISAFVLSPGPGHPDEAHLFLDTIDFFKGKKPILGVCLGHQAVARYFGADVRAADTIVHGHSVSVEHNQSFLFAGITNPFLAMRYNSLTVDTHLPEALQTTAWGLEDGSIMGLCHKNLQIYGVQFHPESVGTPQGERILSNFLKSITRSDTDIRSV